jgi:hypothetical protein
MESRFAHEFAAGRTHLQTSSNATAGLNISAEDDPLEREAKASAEGIVSTQSEPIGKRYDLSHVRVHTDDRAAASTRALDAHAYTVGHDVVFGAGEYAPETHRGARLLAHELTHVVQQGAMHQPHLIQRDSMGGVQSIGTDTPGADALKLPSDINLQFNALDASHRLIESIDQSQVKLEDDPDDDSRLFKRKRLVRHVDFPAVLAVLSNLTADEVKEVEARYLAYEHRPLEYDLFRGGESHVWTDLTTDQIYRLKALLGGTRASSEKDAEAAAQHRREGDVAELHALLNGSLQSNEIERVMTLLRRPAEAAAALLNEYNLNYNLGSDLFRMGFSNAIRAMMLLSGSTIAADAYAIGMARNRIIAIDKELKTLQPTEATLTSVLITVSQVSAPSVAMLRRQQIEALTAERKGQVRLIEERVQETSGEARKEAEDEGRDSLDTDTAIRTRVSAVLGPPGATEAVVGGASGKLIGAIASNEPADQVAAQLRKLYEAGDLTTEAMADAFRTLRMQAAEEAQRRYPDATADELEEQERKLSDQWFMRLRSTWDAAVIGQGPTFSELLDKGDQTEVDVKRRLYLASGRLEPADELILALAGDRKDMETVKRVLRDKKADQIRDLKLQYQRKTIQPPVWPMGRSLDFDLFGEAPTRAGEENPEMMGQYLKLQGKASGSDRLVLEDYLQRPQNEGGVEEVLYISARAEREYEYTIDNRGATGWWRDHWGNEARSLLDATINEVREKRAEYLALINADTEAAHSENAHLIIRDMQFARATIRGDRAGYEKATAELRATFQAVASFVLQAVLTAVLTPVATALFAARLAQAGAMAVRFATWTKDVAVSMASTIAANKMVYGNDYTTDMLLRDLKGGLGSALGATGVERLLGPVTQRLNDRLGKTLAGEIIAGAKGLGGMEVTAILEGEPANTFEDFLEQHFLGKVGAGITHITAMAFEPGPKTATRRGAIEEPHTQVRGTGAGHEIGPPREIAAEPLAGEFAEAEPEAAVSMRLPEPGVVPGREAKPIPHAEKYGLGAESTERASLEPMAGERAPDEPAPREATGVDVPPAAATKPLDDSVAVSGKQEHISTQQADAEMELLGDNPRLIEGEPPNRKAKIGDHEWREDPAGRWCRYSNIPTQCRLSGPRGIRSRGKVTAANLRDDPRIRSLLEQAEKAGVILDEKPLIKLLNRDPEYGIELVERELRERIARQTGQIPELRIGAEDVKVEAASGIEGEGFGPGALSPIDAPKQAPPLEGPVKGEAGQASHALEVVGASPREANSILSKATLEDMREALISEKMSLRQFLERFNRPEGIAEVRLPTGAGDRIIDHMYWDGNKVVLRESKNVEDFRLGMKIREQFDKDLDLLRLHPEARVEWRITGTVDNETLATLNLLQKENPGRFSFCIGPVVPI